MKHNKYIPNHTISLLCEHKKQYQKNMLIAWFAVIILTSIVCWYFLTIENSYSEKMSEKIVTSSFENNDRSVIIPKSSGSSGDRTEKSKNNFFTSAGKVKYKIVKVNHFTNLELVKKSTPTIYTDLDSMGSDDLGAYSLDFAYSDGDEFGLPGELSMIDYYYKERAGLSSGYNFTKIILSAKSSIACIDWVHPRWPKKGIGVSAVVSILVQVSSNGKKDCKILKDDYPIYGFAEALLEAINESIFWLAKDYYGKKLSGTYLITYDFCEKCKENTLEILSGDVVIKPRKQL